MQRSRSHAVVCKSGNARVCTMQLPQDHYVIHSQQISIHCAVCVQPESVSWLAFETTKPNEIKFWPLAQHDLCRPTTEIICGLQILLACRFENYICICLFAHMSMCMLVCEHVWCANEWVCAYGHEYVCGWVHHGIWVLVRGQLVGSGFLSPCGSWGSNSGHKDWEQAPLHRAILPAHLLLYIKKGCKNVFCDWVNLCLGLTIAGYNLQHLFLSACYFQGRQKRGGHGSLWASTPFILLSFSLLHF